MRKHYWLIIVKTSEGEFSLNVDSSVNFINKGALVEFTNSVKNQNSAKEAMVTSVSYLGEMTEDEWNQ